MPPPRRVLVVDDETSTLFALKDYLGTQGFAVDAAASLREAEELLAGSHYDCVVTDLSLEGASTRDGFTILDRVQEEHPLTATILITSHYSDEIAAEGHRRGARHVIAKPVTLAMLRQLIVTATPPRPEVRHVER